MTAHTDTTAITEMLAQRTATQPEDWFLVFKARYGMHVVLRALRDQRGHGDVVTQIFTCATAVTPILTAGLTPVYGDISADTLAIEPAGTPRGDRTRAIMLQHTFGMIDAATAAALRGEADGLGALLLEDSAHCVGRTAQGPDGRPLADVSFHSFGVEKMLPTRFGGAVWVNPKMADSAVRDQIVADLRALAPAGRRLDLVARIYRTQIRVLNRLPKRIAATTRDILTRIGAFEPAIAAAELRGTLTHKPLAPSRWMLGQIAAHLPGLSADEARRSAVVSEYVRDLAEIVQIPEGARGGASMVRFPIFVADQDTAERLVSTLNSSGVYASRWYRPALFPGVQDPAVFGYTPGSADLAQSEDLISRVVNLPTNVSLSAARHAIDVVRGVISRAETPHI